MHCCVTCKKTFKNLRTFTLHMNSESHKKRENNELKLHVCDCGMSFQHQQGLYRHKQSCTYQQERRETNSEIDKLLEEKQALQEQVKQLQAHNKNNININPFGHETIQYITDDIMEKYVCRVYNGIPMLVKKIHCDPKHPENHNIKMTNHRLPYVKVLNDNNQWVFANKKHTINNLIDKSYLMLETTYEGCRDELPGYSQRNFEQFQTKFIAGDKETMKSLNENVQMVLLNGSL